MTIDYIDGPASEPWEVIPDDTEFVIQRAGCDERDKARGYKMPYEYHFRVLHRMEADCLCNLLNQRDAFAAWQCADCGARFPQAVRPELLQGVTHCSKCVEVKVLAAQSTRLRQVLTTLADAADVERQQHHYITKELFDALQAAREVLQ